VRTASKKSQILKKKKPKSQSIFLTLTTSKKAKFVKFGVKKANLATLAYSTILSHKGTCNRPLFVHSLNSLPAWGIRSGWQAAAWQLLFFSLDLGFFCFPGVLGFFLKIWILFTLVKF